MRPLDLTRPWCWLLTVGWPPGQAVRLSSRPAHVTNGSRVYHYTGGLPPIRWRSEVPLFGVAVGQASLTVDVDLGADVAQRTDAHALEDAPAELAVHFLGETWAQRVRVLQGRVRRAVVGVEGQPVTLEIAEDAYEDLGSLVSADDVITDTDWPDALEAALDQVYPLVIGAPGVYRSSAGAAETPGSPAYVVRRTTPVANVPLALLIAGHHVAATSVGVYNVATGVTVSRDVYNSSIGEGASRRLVAYVDLLDPGGAGLISEWDSATVTADVDADEWCVIWNDGGALYTSTRDGALHGAGEILERVLAASSLRVDRGRTAAARTWLDRYRIATYADDSISPWEWVRKVLLPLVPVSMASGPDGVYPVPWRLDAGGEDAVAHLVIGQNAAWASRDEPGDADRYTEVRVSLAPDDTTGDAQRTLTVRPDPSDGADEGRSSYALRSLQREGQDYQSPPTQRVLEVSLDQVHDADTGWLHALDQLGLGHRPGRVVELDVLPEVAGFEHGDVVLITGDARSWSRRVGHVVAVEWSAAYARVSAFVPYQ